MSFWVAGGTVVAGIGGALISSNAAGKAADAQRDAANTATGEQQREYDTSRSDYAPWRDAGGAAVNRLNAASSGDMSAFQASPDYQFTRSEGQRDLGNSFAAKGGAFSGNALRALDEFNTNLASTQYGNWFGQQAQLAGLGVGATAGTTQAGVSTTNAMNQNTLAAGNARASGIATQGNIWGGLLNNLGNYGASKLMTSNTTAPSGYNGNYGAVQW